ncbi:MAG: hypothetical protein J3K34DRAFT_514240 [Monoraphidium minutum]|nr:MAG: hypothetical protein J3K34DRAFT_514240 [Monoraphidium minutum]
MANVTYDIMWREAIMELLDQLEAENPEDASLAPKDLPEWAVIYTRYLQIFRRLEAAYDQVVHPQKRQDIRRALEACMGRMLEVRHWMVKLNRGLDFVSLDDVLVDLKLPPGALEVPVPRYFVEDRVQELEDRDKFLGALLEKYRLEGAGDGGTDGGAAGGTAPQQFDDGGIAGAPPGGGGRGARAAEQRGMGVPIGPPMAVAEAAEVIARNERGRQARARAAAALARRPGQAAQERRRRGGAALGREEAAVRIQSAARGFLWRARVRRAVEAELQFIGMLPHAPDPGRDPRVREASTLLARKRLQLAHLAEFDGAVVALKAKVREAEGQDMREAIQDKARGGGINAWFIQNRNPETGAYPEFPDEAGGGSKTILNPPPPTVAALIAESAAAAAAAGAKGGKKGAAAAAAGGGKKGDKAGGGKKGGAAGGKDRDDGAAPEEAIGSAFVPLIEAAVAEYVAKWQDRDESSNFEQRHDPELVQEELRPLVFEEVDGEMRVLLSNLRDMVEAELAAKAGKKKKKGGKAGGGKKKDKKAKGGGGGGKKKKDPTARQPAPGPADRSMESLYAELVSNGVLVRVPPAHMADYLGAHGFMGATLDKAGIVPDPSMAQIRQAVSEYAILPLGSAALHERLPYTRAMLLFGAPRTGKTLLSHAVAAMTGSNLFDLSPRNIDGRYPGKAAAMLAHMVFKVARTMAPSVVLIDEVEKVFVSDKKRAKEFGGQARGGAGGGEPFSRIRKDLVKEVKALRPGDRVLVLGNSREPWLAAKKDERGFLSFWDKALHLPLPDYASRRLLWPGLFARRGGPLPQSFDVSTLAHLSEGYAAGGLDAAVGALLSGPRLARLRAGGPRGGVDIPEILQWLSRVRPVSKEEDAALRRWADKTPALAAIKGATADKPGGAAAGGAKKKGAGDAGGGKKKGKK